MTAWLVISLDPVLHVGPGYRYLEPESARAMPPAGWLVAHWRVSCAGDGDTRSVAAGCGPAS